MNKKNLLVTSTKNMSREQWLAFRQPINHVNALLKQHCIDSYEKAAAFFKSDVWLSYIFPCVGGSEVATISGLDPYRASIEVFYSKVGVAPIEIADNAAMFWGRELEEVIAQKWQYWGGDAESLFDNFKAKKMMQKCHRVNAYLQNKAFPWVFVSLDRFIKQWGKQRQPGVLECKTMSEWVAKQWENGLPPSYVVQAVTQMAVTETVYGEIAYLKDGRYFDVLPFDFNQSIAGSVIDNTHNFFTTVKQGIEHFALSNFATTESLRQDHLHEIDMLAPAPDDSVGYQKYLSQRFSAPKDFGKPGTAQQFEWAEGYDDCNRQLAVWDAKKIGFSNKLKDYMGEASKIDFGTQGSVTWKANNKGSRTFRVDIKRPEGIIYKETMELLTPAEQLS